MNRELLKQCLDALKSAISSHGRILTSNPPQDAWTFNNVDQRCNDAINALETELAKPINEFNPDWDQQAVLVERIRELEKELAKPEQEPTVPDNMQDWAKLDGAIAWQLIERHADNWADIGKMMNEYVAAKLTEQALDKKADNARELGLDYEPEQEPVVLWSGKNSGDEGADFMYPESIPDRSVGSEHTKILQAVWNIPLYTSPPRKEWLSLESITIRQLKDIHIPMYSTPTIDDYLKFARAIEAKLKEKNT